MSKKTKHKDALTVEVTVATFDRGQGRPPYRAIRRGTRLDEWRPLTSEDYRPSGTTPLLDATARFIADLAEARRKNTVVIGALADESGSMSVNRDAVISGVNEFVESMRGIAADPNAAGKVLACILTDGLENASSEMTALQVRKLIAGCEAKGWTFIYMGANQDAWSSGGELGLSGGASGQRVNYVGTPEGTRSALREMSRRASRFLGDSREFELHAASAPDSSLDERGELRRRTPKSDRSSD